MFVVYVKKGDKKERLYFKATDICALINCIWETTNLQVVQIKQLKRIYRKNDVFEVV